MTEEREFLNSELHKAIANRNFEAVEDLLSSNEWSKIELTRALDALHELNETSMSPGIVPPGVFQEVGFREIRDLLDLHAFGHQHPEHCFSITSFRNFRNKRLIHSSMSIRQLMQHGNIDMFYQPIEHEFDTTWIHVPSTNVSNYLRLLLETRLMHSGLDHRGMYKVRLR
jgi:hypothetical protein